jgi:tetratricopeptide (TPR) repeat protein
MHTDATNAQHQRIEHARQLLERKDFNAALDAYLALKQDGYKGVDYTIGWIYNNLPIRDLQKSIEYQKIASGEGNALAQHALGGLYFEIGDLISSVESYKLAADNGRDECLFLAHHVYRKLKDTYNSDLYLSKAVKNGDPFAIRNFSFDCMLGKKGLAKIPVGIITYIKNVPRLIRAARTKMPNQTSRK